MTIATLRPNSTDATTGAPTITGGASHHAVQSDNSDASYSGTATGSITVGFTTVAIPALAQIRSVTARVRYINAVGSVLQLATQMLASAVAFAVEKLVVNSSTITTVTQTARLTNPSGVGWTQADIDSLQYKVAGGTNGIGQTAAGNIYESYIDVLYNEAPVATVTAPTEGGSVTTTTRPTITWTYSDPEADVQERYQVKIFSAAQYGIGGFDPETSPNTWDSGEVFSPIVSFVLPIDLTNGTTYRAYVKVADAGSNGRYSNWDNNTFTINVTAPPAPTLTITAQPANADGPRNKIDITRAASATPTTYMFIEYSDDGGTTWGYLGYTGTYASPAASPESIVNSPDGTTFTYYDYTAIPGTQRSYRAKAVRTV